MVKFTGSVLDGFEGRSYKAVHRVQLPGSQFISPALLGTLIFSSFDFVLKIRPMVNRTEKKKSVSLIKSSGNFIFVYNNANIDETLRQVAKWASDPELDFTWYDAALVSKKIRESRKVQG